MTVYTFVRVDTDTDPRKPSRIVHLAGPTGNRALCGAGPITVLVQNPTQYTRCWRCDDERRQLHEQEHAS